MTRWGLRCYSVLGAEAQPNEAKYFGVIAHTQNSKLQYLDSKGAQQADTRWTVPVTCPEMAYHVTGSSKHKFLG